eukprot:14258853-Alexandrium_andersonii.AAC.1
MSASLVGSEMCIRDRPFWTPHQPAQNLWRAYGVIWRGQGRRLHTHRPVSYTHLTLPTICSV